MYPHHHHHHHPSSPYTTTTSPPLSPFRASSMSSSPSETHTPTHTQPHISSTPPSSPPPLFSSHKRRVASTPTRLLQPLQPSCSPDVASSPPVFSLKSHRLSPLLSDRVLRYESGAGREGEGVRKLRFGREEQEQERSGSEDAMASMYTACDGIYTVYDTAGYNTATAGPSSSAFADSAFRPEGVPAGRPWSFVEGAADEVSVAGLSECTREDRESQVAAQQEYARQCVAEGQRAYATRQEMNEARVYWSSAMAQMDEAAGRGVRDGENDSSCSDHRTLFSLSNLEQTTITHPPSVVVAGVLYENVSALNRERQERALCIDDPDSLLVETFSTKADEGEKEEELPWPEVLKRQLPSPDVFTPCTYRSKHHTVGQVARASACLAVGLQDYALTARALQYNENKIILEGLSSESGQRSASPSTQSFGTGVMTPDSGESQYQESLTLCGSDFEEDVQFNLIAQWELKRDIERLVALQRNIHEARTRLTQYPLLSNYSIRQSKIQRMPHFERSAKPTRDSESDTLLMETMMRSGTHVQRARSVDCTERTSGAPHSNVASLRSLNSQSYVPDMEAPHSSNRHPHPSSKKPLRPYGRQSLPATREQSQWGPSIISPRPSSVHSNAASTVRSETSTQCPSSLRLRLASIEEDRNRIAAQDIVRGLGSVSIRTQRSVSSPIAEPLRHESGRTEERREQVRRSDVVFPSGLRYGEQSGERYPRRQNIG